MMQPDDLETFNQAAQTAWRGDPTQARQLFLGLQKKYPNDFNLWLWLTFTSPDLNRASASLRRAEQLDPANAQLATARQWLRQQEQAGTLPGQSATSDGMVDSSRFLRNQPAPDPRSQVDKVLPSQVYQSAPAQPDDLADLPFEALVLLQENLDLGEQVRWYGQPDIEKVRRSGFSCLGVVLLFSIVFFGFFLLASDQSLFSLVGTLSGVGLFLVVLVWAIFYTARTARYTYYVITDRRLAELKLNGRGSFVGYRQTNLKKLKVSEKEDGQGSINFYYLDGPGSYAEGYLFLRYIPNVRAVAALIREVFDPITGGFSKL